MTLSSLSIYVVFNPGAPRLYYEYYFNLGATRIKVLKESHKPKERYEQDAYLN